MSAGEVPAVPDGEAVREAEAWFSERSIADSLNPRYLTHDALKHAATIVRAWLAHDELDVTGLRSLLATVKVWLDATPEDSPYGDALQDVLSLARDVPAPADLLTLDELTVDVANAFECAAIEVVVWETDTTGARTIESPHPLYRLARCLRSYGLLDERRDRGEDASTDGGA